MKRLLIALAAAVAVSTASAIITDTQLFETSFDDFVADVQGEDSSAITAYEALPSIDAPYPCSGFGSNYLKLDTGDATLWRTNASEAANLYFDMAIQFTPTAEGDEPDPAGNKIVIFMDAETNVVVISGTDATDHTPVTNRYEDVIAAKSWARLTISAAQDQGSLCFRVSIDGMPISRNVFYSLDADTTVREVGFSGSGALDDFVARTTDPYFSGAYAARIGGNPPACEEYATYAGALADALASTTADATTAITLPNDTTINGSAATPYEIKDAASLLALQDAVFANPAVRSLNFVQTANIDMTDVEGFYGIGWFTSTDKYASLPAGVTNKQDIAFAGIYDGAGYTISNVTIVRHNYAGVFNNVSGTVKNLTVQDIGFTGTCDEWGCAIVGNAQGSAVLENLAAETSMGFNWGDSANHNVAGIVVRPVGATIVRGCVNNAAISSTSKRLGGIASFTGGATGDGVRILNCTNNAALSSTDGTRGVGGILGCAEAGTSATATTISGCADFGSETAQGSGGHAGAIVGSNWNGSYTYTDAGGNTFPAASPVCGYVKNPVFGLAYAIDAGIDGGNYLTTVAQADLAAGNTYLLLANVAASETPVYTFATAGTIAFDTALGYTFAGTVTTDNGMLDVTDETVGTVTTFTASEGTVVATITKSGNTTSYSTLQKALAAAAIDPLVTAVDLVGAATGDVIVLLGLTVNVASANLLDAVTSLSGSGVVAMGYTVVPSNALLSLCQQPAWEGTLSLNSINITGAIKLTQLGNTNSTVRFSNCGCAFVANDTTAHAIKALEVGSGGLYFIGNYGSGTFTFPCALTGTGALTIEAKNSDYGTSLKAINFIGDVSGFSGSISFDAEANAYVAFGEDTTNAKCIIVSEGSEATIGSDATWTAPGGIVVKGTLNVGGTVAATIYGATGTGVVNSTNPALTMTSFSSYWNGTYVIGWEGSRSTEIAFNSYGYANSKIKIPSRATLEGFVEVRADNTLTNNAEVVVDGELNLSNGYDYSTVVWKKISGLGTVKYAFAPTHWIKEKIISLEGFSGSIEVSATTQLEIEGVNVAREPVAGDCIVPITVAEGGTVGGDLKLYVSGTETGTLEYKADGADGAGLYVASAPPTTPEVTPSANGTVDCGSAAAATAAATAINADKATYIKAPAAANLDSTAAAAYANLFDARADGNNVVVELNEAGTNALETAATNIAAQVVAPANVASILSGTRSLSLVGAQPGFYYSVVYAANLTALATAAEGGRELANADGEVTLPMPATEVGATAGFYRVLVNVQPKVLE